MNVAETNRNNFDTGYEKIRTKEQAIELLNFKNEIIERLDYELNNNIVWLEKSPNILIIDIFKTLDEIHCNCEDTRTGENIPSDKGDFWELIENSIKDIIIKYKEIKLPDNQFKIIICRDNKTHIIKSYGSSNYKTLQQYIWEKESGLKYTINPKFENILKALENNNIDELYYLIDLGA